MVKEVLVIPGMNYCYELTCRECGEIFYYPRRKALCTKPCVKAHTQKIQKQWTLLHPEKIRMYNSEFAQRRALKKKFEINFQSPQIVSADCNSAECNSSSVV